MRQYTRDLVDIHYRGKARIIARYAFLVGFSHRLLKLLGKCNVGRVARSRCKDLRLQRPSCKREIADDIEKLMPRGLVVVAKLYVV